LCPQIQEIAQELAGQYAQHAGSTGSSSTPGSATAAVASQCQQQLVFELNRSGRYLEIKQQLRPLLVDLVQEKYSTAAAAAGRPSTQEVQQLHHDLYSNLVQQLHDALAEVAKQAAEQHQQQQQQQGGSPEALDGSVQQQQQQGDGLGLQQAAEVQQLLQLAAECELQQDLGRCHDLHIRRIAALPTAQVCLCLQQEQKQQYAYCVLPCVCCVCMA
jgi:hypothetical protein